MPRRSINFLVGNGVNQSDRDAFFGPIPDTDEWFTFVVVGDAFWSDLLVAAGLYPSKSQARKQGWHKPVKHGFDHFFFGLASKWDEEDHCYWVKEAKLIITP